MSVDVILFALALLCLIMAALGVPSRGVALGWLGMALFVLPFLIHAFPAG